MYSHQDLTADVTDFNYDQLDELRDRLMKRWDELKALRPQELRKTDRKKYDEFTAAMDKIMERIDYIALISDRSLFNDLTPEQQDEKIKFAFAHPNETTDYENFIKDSYYVPYLKKLGFFPIKQAEEKEMDHSAKQTFSPSASSGE